MLGIYEPRGEVPKGVLDFLLGFGYTTTNLMAYYRGAGARKVVADLVARGLVKRVTLKPRDVVAVAGVFKDLHVLQLTSFGEGIAVGATLNNWAFSTRGPLIGRVTSSYFHDIQAQTAAIYRTKQGYSVIDTDVMIRKNNRVFNFSASGGVNGVISRVQSPRIPDVVLRGENVPLVFLEIEATHKSQGEAIQMIAAWRLLLETYSGSEIHVVVRNRPVAATLNRLLDKPLQEFVVVSNSDVDSYKKVPEAFSKLAGDLRQRIKFFIAAQVDGYGYVEEPLIF